MTIKLMATFGMCVFASGAQQSQDFLFRVATQLVQVDVLVQDKNGDPVPSLTKDDFTLLDNGRSRNIDVFSVRSLQKSLPKSAASTGRMRTNRLSNADAAPVYATIVLFDQLNTAWENQAWAREKILNYLQDAETGEQIAIYSLFNKLKVIQDFTTDREILARALARTKPEFSLDLKSADTESITQLAPNPTSGGLGGGLAQAKAVTDATEQNATAFMRENAVKRRVEITVAALGILSKHMNGMPDRKKLIWISGAFPLLTKETHQIPEGPTLVEYRDLSDLVQGPVRGLNDANVGVYPIDARGLDTGVSLSDPTIDTMVLLARQTGGRAIYATNDLPGAIKEDMKDTDLTYTLGFYLSRDDLDGSFHKLSVKVSRNDVQVRHRMGYTSSKIVPATPKALQTNLKNWVQQSLAATDVAIGALASPVPEHPGFCRVEVAVDPSVLQLEHKDNRWVGSFDLAVVPDTRGTLRGLHQVIRLNLAEERLRVALSNGITVTNVVQVAGKNGKILAPTLHVVVQDGASGRSGSVRIPMCTQ